MRGFSSMIWRAEVTASFTWRPALRSSSAAAWSLGFSLIEATNYSAGKNDTARGGRREEEKKKEVSPPMQAPTPNPNRIESHKNLQTNNSPSPSRTIPSSSSSPPNPGPCPLPPGVGRAILEIPDSCEFLPSSRRRKRGTVIDLRLSCLLVVLVGVWELLSFGLRRRRRRRRNHWRGWGGKG